MQITSYGLFWREDGVDWSPGRGRRNFRLLGRIGENRPHIQIVDFRRQQGIYILFDQYGPAYVGLAKGDRLGARLKEHRSDHLRNKWDRFSWFGFNPISMIKDDAGILQLEDPEVEVSENTTTTISDLEALVIAAMGAKLNRKMMRFQKARRWEQTTYWDWEEKYRSRCS